MFPGSGILDVMSVFSLSEQSGLGAKAHLRAQNRQGNSGTVGQASSDSEHASGV